MQFENLTPFHSMAFQSLNIHGRYCTIVATNLRYPHTQSQLCIVHMVGNLVKSMP